VILSVNSNISLDSIKNLIFVMVECGVIFEVWTELLYITKYLDELRVKRVKVITFSLTRN
jgi:hypothetical protein